MLAVTGALETCATRNCYFAQNYFAQNYHFLDLISNNREKCNVIPDLWSFQNSDLVILRIIVWLQRISSIFTTTKNMMKNIVRLDFLFLKPTKKTFIGDTNLLIYILEMRNACMALI